MSESEKAGVNRPSRPPNKIEFPDIKDWNSVRITLQRSRCFGWCPSYKVEIQGDGAVNYEGYYFVIARGVRHSKVDSADVHALVEKFRKAEFFWSFDVYQDNVTDAPAFMTTIAFDGHEKKVGDYLGTDVGMPQVFRDLEGEVDRTADTEQWVGTEAERQEARAKHRIRGGRRP